MAPERLCSMLDNACFVLVGTNEPAGSNLEPPVTATKRKVVKSNGGSLTITRNFTLFNLTSETDQDIRPYRLQALTICQELPNSRKIKNNAMHQQQYSEIDSWKLHFRG